MSRKVVVAIIWTAVMLALAAVLLYIDTKTCQSTEACK